ncbi:MAG: hypothetical protein GEU77_13785 [Deltaproteobacteria bacterium]|nr:hypothetical protein [Deltaproteobacteria bacterium]
MFHADASTVPGDLAALDHSRWIKARPNYLFPVKALSRVFRGKFLGLVQQACQRGKIEAANNQIKAEGQKNWIVYAKKAFGSPHTVLDYLGRYTHRVDLTRCPCCHNGSMIVVGDLPPMSSPSQWDSS